MSKLLQLRGGTTSEHASFTGAVREVTVDTTKDTLVVHDGSTAGGHALSTAADVSAALATLVDSAPATLNTLNELAAALGDDANYATTTTTAIGTKMPLAGGAFTGAVTTNSTFDGRDVATDGTKLDAIEASATADQTAAQIKAHLEDGIDSIHYVNGSVDNEHISGMAASKLTGALPAISGAALTGVQPFPSGTVMVFHQTAAPTGWTKSTSHNDKALRVVSGNGGGNGGTHDLSSPPSLAHTHTGAAHTHTINHGHSNNLSAAAHTLSTAQLASHRHGPQGANGLNGQGTVSPSGKSTGGNNLWYTAYAGSNSSHSHGMSGSVTAHSGNSGSGGGAATSSTTPTAFAPKYIDVIICAKD